MLPGIIYLYIYIFRVVVPWKCVKQKNYCINKVIIFFFQYPWYSKLLFVLVSSRKEDLKMLTIIPVYLPVKKNKNFLLVIWASIAKKRLCPAFLEVCVDFASKLTNV